MTTYFGLAIADGMFAENAKVIRHPMTAEDVKALLIDPKETVVSCCNPSHSLTLEALKEKFGIEVPIPEKAPFVKLQPGNAIVVMSARFPRRLNEGERWTREDVENAEFKFGKWTVIG